MLNSKRDIIGALDRIARTSSITTGRSSRDGRREGFASEGFSSGGCPGENVGNDASLSHCEGRKSCPLVGMPPQTVAHNARLNGKPGWAIRKPYREFT